MPSRASQAALDAFQAYAERFNRQEKWLSKSLIFLLIPALTGWLWLLYPSRWKHPEHRGLLAPLVQATHLSSAMLFLLARTVIAFWIIAFARGASVSVNATLDVAFGVIFVPYIAAALRYARGATGWKAWMSAEFVPWPPRW